jgi:hypothetical protein
MANSIKCLDLTTDSVYFNGLPLNNGTIVSAWDNSDPSLATRNCVTINDVDDPTAFLTANTIYNSCYQCLVNNYTVVALESCDSATQFSVDLSQFSEIPTLETSYFIRAIGNTDTYIGCFKIRTINQFSLDDYNSFASDFYQIEFLSTASFPDCDTCLTGFTSGQEYTMCEICCECTTGQTVTEVVVPHPSYTNIQSQTIIQLDAITLGGFNGLNN